MTHEFDSQPALHTLAEMRGRGDTWLDIVNEFTDESKGRGEYAMQAGRLVVNMDKAAAEVRAKVDKYNNLKTQVEAERVSKDTPRATSAYETVSAFDTREPMPEWTTSKEGRNVQRVDVVIPQSKEIIKASMLSDNPKIQKLARENASIWQPDSLHENLPNTLGLRS